MGIFSRFIDIVNSEINSLLDKAENPIKMMALIIQEMNDTLIEMRSTYRDNLEKEISIDREIEKTEIAVDNWHARAKAALARDEEKLAREALIEKHKLQNKINRLKEEKKSFVKVNAELENKINELIKKIKSRKEEYNRMKENNKPTEDENLDNKFRNSDIEDELEKMKKEMNQ